MFCTMCGTRLTNENRAGLVCFVCHPKANSREFKQAITVRYCYICGKPYMPQDESISHMACSVLFGNMPHRLDCLFTNSNRAMICETF